MIGTLEDIKLKQKWNAAYTKFCQSRVCDNDCPVKKEATRLKVGCMLVFCRMKESGKI